MKKIIIKLFMFALIGEILWLTISWYISESLTLLYYADYGPFIFNFIPILLVCIFLYMYIVHYIGIGKSFLTLIPAIVISVPIAFYGVLLVIGFGKASSLGIHLSQKEILESNFMMTVGFIILFGTFPAIVSTKASSGFKNLSIPLSAIVYVPNPVSLIFLTAFSKKLTFPLSLLKSGFKGSPSIAKYWLYLSSHLLH